MKDKLIYTEHDVLDLLDESLDTDKKRETAVMILQQYSLYKKGGNMIKSCIQRINKNEVLTAYENPTKSKEIG